MNLLHPERLRALAREYALGTLHGGARRRFGCLLREQEPARRELALWQEQFAALAAAVPPVAPRPQVWAALEHRLGLQPARAAAGWRRWLDGRSWGGALGGALCVLLLGTAVLQSQPGWLGLEPLREGLPASYVGLLSNPAGQPGLLLSARRHGMSLTAKLLQPLTIPPGRVAALWAFPKAGGKPFLVGTLPAAGTGALRLPQSAEKLFFTVERLAVSFEAPGMIGEMPGADLALAGPCVKLW